jgi:uroporphyrinogen decarboxylase
MKSRERVLKALRHQEPDRVPLDSGGCSATTISAKAYARLRRHLGVKGGPVAVFDAIQQLALPEQWYLDKYEVDVVDVTREACLDTSNWLDWRLSDGTEARIPPWVKLERRNGEWVYRDAEGDVLGRMPAKGDFFDQAYWPMAAVTPDEYSKPEKYLSKTMWAAMGRPLMVRSRDPEFPGLLREAARKLYTTTDYALMLNSGVSLFESAQFLRRIDNLLADLLADRKNIERLLDRLLELNLKALERQLDACGQYIQVIKINDDLGTQTAPQISPRIFREIFKPRYKVMYDLIKRKKPGIFIFLHSCGAIHPFLQDLIDVGLDIINPVQTSATGMEPERLKREFGRHLTFWGGGVNTQHVLPWGTPEQVTRDVEEKVRVFAPGGGFIFNQSHNIAPEVPSENIVAMFEAFRRIRNYPIE